MAKVRPVAGFQLSGAIGGIVFCKRGTGAYARAHVVPREMLLNHRSLVLQDPDVVQAALAHYRKRSKVGFSHCMVLEVARKAGHVPLGTFDRQLSKLDGTEAL